METAFYIDVNPVIFTVGPFSLGWYGLMALLAVLTLLGWIIWANLKANLLSWDTVFNSALLGLFSGVVFSKLLHVIDQWDYYVHYPAQILSGQGLSIWGAIIGATLAVWLYGRFSGKYSFARLGDMIAPGIILAQAIGRVGCTFNGCCYGIESHSPLSVIYQHPGSFAPLGIPVLPTQVFEIFYNLAAFSLLLFLRGKLKPDGSLFALYLALYAAWRFGIEFIRAGTPFLFGMHQAQFISLVVLMVIIPFIVLKVRWERQDQTETTAEPAGK